MDYTQGATEQATKDRREAAPSTPGLLSRASFGSRTMWLVFSLIALSYVSSTAEACSCMTWHPQNHFCNADYVIKVRILGSHMIYSEPVEKPVEKSTKAPEIIPITEEPEIIPITEEPEIIPSTEETEEAVELPEVASLKEGEPLILGAPEFKEELREPGELLEGEPESDSANEEVSILELLLTPPPIPVAERQPIYQSYRVKINRIFKGEELIAKLNDTDHIVTNAYGSLCGLTQLSNATRYLMMGRIYKGKMWISLCSYVREWTSLTLRMKKNIRYNYDRNCDCKVDGCFTENCQRVRQKKSSTCQWATRTPESQCYVDQSYCQLRSQGHCKWSRNSATMECIKQENSEAKAQAMP